MLSISLASDGDDVASMAWTLNVTYPVAARQANVRVLRFLARMRPLKST